jgi:putative acetyltransferase
VIIRVETTRDHEAVHGVHESAFGRPYEATLVETLRAVTQPHVSLVADLDGAVVGHIFFSPVSIESAGAIHTAIGLAPLAVLPEHQRQGIGSQLVRAGLRRCQEMGHDIGVVAGHPAYYPRFGFVPAKRQGVSCDFDLPEDAFMVAELRPGALAGRQGVVHYHPAFRDL